MDKYRQRIFPFIFLSIIVAYTYALFENMPYLGFYYTYRDEITDSFVPEAEILKGGILLEVDGEDWTSLKNDIYRPVFLDLEPGDSVELTILKDGQTSEIEWVLPTDVSAELTARLRSTWWLPLVFWLSGTVVWFNVRPRNKTWRLLFWFNMLIAIYLAGLNGPSLGNRMLSVPVVRFIGAMVLPVFLQLHWEFPYPLTKLPRHFVSGVYGVSFMIAMLAAFNILPPEVFLAMSMLSVIGSLLLMVYKRFVQPEHIRDNDFVLFTFALIFLPPLITTITYTYFDIPLGYSGFIGAYMAMPALPAVYFLIAFQKQMYGERNQRRNRLIFIGIVLFCSITITALLVLIGNEEVILGFGTILLFMSAVTSLSFSAVLIPMLGLTRLTPKMIPDNDHFVNGLQPRSNRFIIPYFFLVIFGVFTGALILFVNLFLPLPLRESEIIAVTGFVVATMTLVFYPSFRRFIERYVFGVVQPPDELIESFSRRITTSLSLIDLSNLFVREVLPTLLIRQSSLYHIDETGKIDRLFAMGIPADPLPDIDALIPQLPKGEFMGTVFNKNTPSPFPDWVQVVLPLRIARRLIGVWLLGSHDPDDEYTYLDLSTLSSIASQTAIALSNILLTNQLQAHYQADIDREEADRVDIARGLHDQVLNQLASLAMEISSGKSREELLESYEKVKFNLRELITRLRPAVLDFGLSHALHEMASQLMDTYPNARVTIQLPYHSVRYDPKVESHVFNIIQHVCENACLHSGAEEIIVSGFFEEDMINIAVVDDGDGFNFQELSLSQLIEKRHFGLVGMRERAELIHANLVFDTSPGAGTRVYLRWEKTADD